MIEGVELPAVPASAGERGRRRLGLILTLVLAAGVRWITWQQVEESPLWYLQLWTQTDMAFYDGWAHALLAGNLWSDPPPRPYHRWHEEVATAAHRLSGSPLPFDEAAGRQIWNGWLGEKTFYQDPLYAYFLAAVYVALGDTPGSAFAVQAVLGVGTTGLVFWLALRLFGATVALVAGPLAALFGPLVLYDFVLLRTSLAAFLGIATVLAVGAALAKPGSRGLAAGAGALAGLSLLLRAESLIFTAALAFFAAWIWRRQARRLGQFLAWSLCGFALALAPLVVRNLVVGAPLLGVAASGAVTFINHNAIDALSGGGDFVSAHSARILSATGGRFGPAAAAALATHAGPSTVLALLGRKLVAFWTWYELPNNVNYYYFLLFAKGLAAVAVSFAWVAPLALVGVVLAWPRRRAGFPGAGTVERLAPALLFVGSGLLVSLVFYNLSRFRAPYAAALIPFAAFALVEIARAVRAHRFLLAALAAGAAGLLGLALSRPLPAGAALIQTADYGASNEIAGELVRRRLATGDAAGGSKGSSRAVAIALLERQLATEPADLQALMPGPAPSSLALVSAELAGSFAPLHALAARLYDADGRPQEAARERFRAQVLGVVSAQFAAAPPRRSP